jgi:hypothetical protein
MDVQKIKLMGVIYAIGCVGSISDIAAIRWEDVEAQFSHWVAEHEVKSSDEVSSIHRELCYLREIEERNPWDNLRLRLSEEYPAIAEAWIIPVRLMFLKERFTGTREEWQAKHRGILSLHLEHLRDRFQGNVQELDVLIALICTTGELEEAEIEEVQREVHDLAFSPVLLEEETSTPQRSVVLKEPSRDIDVDQASLLEEDIRRMEAMNAQFLREKFSFTDEQIEQFRATFGEIYDELVGDL